MKILCKILSSNQLVYNKFEVFFFKSPFFILTRDDETDFDILVWDIDSVETINITSEGEKDNKPVAVIMITSYYNESILSKKAALIQQSNRVVYMHKNIKYNEFLDEICYMIDGLYT